METLVVDRRGARLSLDAGRVRIERDGEPPRFVPVAAVRRLVVSAGAHIESGLLGALAEAGAGVLVLSPRDHRRTALMLPPFGGEHAARMKQYARANDASFALEVARVLLRRKLRGQWRVLRGMRGGPRTREAMRAWPELTARLRAAAGMPSLLGVEGGAAGLYFAAMREHLPESLGFSGRARRPPPDPVNALLSLAYTLLHFDAVRAIHATGLDPCIGFLHAPEHNRESLACDLIEPLRPEADALALGLFARRALRAEHFGRQQGACRLNKAGRAVFYRAWEAFAAPRRRALRRGALLLRRAVTGA